MRPQEPKKQMNRRRFLRSAAATGAGLMFAKTILAQTGTGKRPDDINLALLGAGQQGYVLLNACLKIPGIRFKAVCDIWEAYNLRRATRLLDKVGHTNNAYVDYKEMLDREKDLDAIIIATPDFRHAEHTIACLKAGLHVYCEKEMSNKLEDARKMVLAARETGKLLQIGHQRRSNPLYIYCYDKLVREAKLLGQIAAVNGQWNRSIQNPQGWPKGTEIKPEILAKYGYKSADHFLNWRWYKGLGGGPIVDLGSHQIDVYNWFLDALPTSVMASGRTNYYDKATHEWYDTVMAVFEYDTPRGPVSAYYQTITTNSSQGYFETFMGHEGTLLMSERASRCKVYRESWVPETNWDNWVKKGYLLQKEGNQQPEQKDAVTDARDSIKPAEYDLPVQADKVYHQPHLENFFDAIRGKAKLTCPADIAYETAVAVLKVNEAVEAGKKLEFKQEEFKI
jgi:predicted dehydrogenase